jgi:ABC-type glutathione transport system ATPase component
VVQYRSDDGSSTTAVNGVTFAVAAGSAFGLVGESGSGKSTAVRAMLGLVKATSGEVWFDGQSILNLSRGKWRQLRSELQIVYQDPESSLDPLMTVRKLVEEPLLIHRARLGLRGREERLARVRELLLEVGLGDDYLDTRPGSLSGGQLQRVAIARALACKPRVLVCDEVVSALDVSVKAQLLMLLQKLQEAHRLTLVFISHDLSVVNYLCDQVAVMWNGRIVECGPTIDVLTSPQEQYTKDLLASIPHGDIELERQARAGRLHERRGDANAAPLARP